MNDSRNWMLEDEERELQAARRVAGILTGGLLASIFGYALFYMVVRRWYTVQTTPLGMSDLLWIVVLSLVTVLSLAVAYHLKTAVPGRGWRLLGAACAAAMALAAIIAGWLAILG